ncbi:ketopantoate reductase family protein [Actinoplanes sp. NPDC051494]|uniref:ketopantoate reductase family protein n=1 Tax=Actinoplanes sp. NPDC051494 TaxID=3363907 RepID=UPI0037BDBAE2
MRVLVVGAGATGGYFGGRLAGAGRDVTFLVRPARAARLAERGLRITGPSGESRTDVRTVTAGTLDSPYDLVLLSVKSYGLDQAIADITPAVGARTVIVPLLNGMRHVDTLLAAFGPERVWGGICMINSTLTEEGDISQMTAMARLVHGPFGDAPDDRLDAVTAALSGAGFESRASGDIVQEMWEKWAFLSGIGVATTLAGGTIGDITAVPGGLAYASAVAGEALAIATAAGHRPRDSWEKLLRDSITALGVPATSSMYRDMTAGAPVEAEAIVGDMVAHAERLGVPAPLFNAARVRLAIYSARR